MGLTIAYSYNEYGQKTAQTDPNGLTTEMTYDSRNRLIERKTGMRSMKFAYNARDQITQVTDELGRVVTIDYDDAKHPVKIIYPSGDDLSMTYTYLSSYTEVARQYHSADGTAVSTRIHRLDPLTEQPKQDYLASISQRIDQQQYNHLNDRIQETR